MDISKLTQLSDFNLKELQEIYNTIQQNNNNDNLNKEIQKNILPKIMLIIKNMDISLQKTLINTWIKMNLPLNENYIKGLIKYLQNNTFPYSGEKRATVKAYAFLLKNDLPLKTPLIRALSTKLNPGNSLSKILNELIDKKELPPEVKNNLILDFKKTPEKILTEIKEYPQKLQEALSLLAENKNSKTANLFKYLLGQQTINTNNNFLLALEIPVQILKNKQTFPLFLQVSKNKKEKKSSQEERNNEFKICFIIELPYNKLIKSNTVVSNNTIQLQFSANSKNLCILINNNFSLLEEKLEKLGYNIKNFRVEKLPLHPEKAREFFLENILFDNIQNNNYENYTPIDFKI